MQRRLTAILAADVAGYSRLMGEDEAGTLARLRQLRNEAISPAVSAHGGNIVKTTGDGFLVEFPSTVEAVECAVEIQRAIAERGAGDAPASRMELRIGINLGDVIVEEGDIYGDGVNIAARLEGLAQAGGTCISRSVRDQIRDKLPYELEDRGEIAVKNIARPVRAFAVRVAGLRVMAPAKLAPAEPLALPDKPSIAVLPFTNMSGDPEQEYFADGITEDIITALSRIHWFFVIARNSTFTYKGRPIDVTQVGRELGVRYVLEGSVRKGGGRVRITAQLIEAASRRHVWAERFDGDVEDIFDLQDSVTARVVGAVEPSLLMAEMGRSSAKPTDSLDAYDLYLRALPHAYAFTESGFRAAEALLLRALEIDARYAEAWTALGDVRGRLVFGGWSDFHPGGAQACEAALRATALDPGNGTSLSLAAWALAIFAARHEQATQFVERALHLHPNSPYVRTNCAWALISSGEMEEALPHLELARRMSPLDPRGYITMNATAAAHFYARRFDEAARCAHYALQLSPSHAIALRYLAASLVQMGMVAEAAASVAELRRIQPQASITRIAAHASTYRHEWMRELYLGGLRLAGLPEE